MQITNFKRTGYQKHEIVRSLYERAEELPGVRAEINGDRPYVLSFVLRCDSSDNEYARRALSGTGRRTNSANWWAHLHVLRGLFAEFPEVTVRTQIVTYSGRDDFEAKYPATYRTPVGVAGHQTILGSL